MHIVIFVQSTQMDMPHALHIIPLLAHFNNVGQLSRLGVTDMWRCTKLFDDLALAWIVINFSGLYHCLVMMYAWTYACK